MKHSNSSFDGVPKLVLKDLLGEVYIRPGQDGKITVRLSVEDDFFAEYSVEQTDPETVTVSGPKSVFKSLPANFHLNLGDVSNSNFNFGSGNQINDSIKRNLKVEITAPAATSVQAFRVRKLDMAGLTGMHSVKLSGSATASVVGGKDCTFDVSGDSDVSASDLSGNVSAIAAGASVINAVGTFKEAYLESAGGSLITVIGNSDSCTADASGASQIRIVGIVAGNINRSVSGASSIKIG